MILFGSNTTGKSKCCFVYPVEIPEIKRASMGFVKSIPTRNSPALTKNSKRFVRPVGSENNRKIGAFF